MEAGEVAHDALKGRIETAKIERERYAEAEGTVRKVEQEAAVHEAKLEKLERRVPELAREIATLEGRREIYQADTELDSLMTTLKLFFALICEFVLREYFAGMRLSLHGFMRHILALPGTRTIEGKVEHIRIKASPNREIMLAVEAACERLNARGFERDGRTVKLSVQWPEPAKKRVSKTSS